MPSISTYLAAKYKHSDSSFQASSQLTASIQCSYCCTVHVYVVIHLCDNVWSFWVEANLYSFFYPLPTFLYTLYMHCRWRSIYQDGRVVIPLPGLTTPHFCACYNTGSGYPAAYVAVFCYVQWVEVGGGCLFCWYWWNWWQLFMFSFHDAHTPLNSKYHIHTPKRAV